MKMDIHEKIAADVPAIERGIVWCRTCLRSQQVDGADCLRTGWPKCCGYTMTIYDLSEEARQRHPTRTPAGQ